MNELVRGPILMEEQEGNCQVVESNEEKGLNRMERMKV